MEVVRGLGMGGAENLLVSRLKCALGGGFISAEQVRIVNTNGRADHFENAIRSLGVRVITTKSSNAAQSSFEIARHVMSAKAGTIWVSHSPMASLPAKAVNAVFPVKANLIDVAHTTHYKTPLLLAGKGLNRYAAKCLAVSEAVAGSPAVRGYSNVVVVRPGIDLDRVRHLLRAPVGGVGALRDQIGVSSEGGRLVCAVGSLNRLKGHHLLVEALAEPGLGDFHLIILGEGPERESIECLARALNIEDRVHLLGICTDPLPWIAASDVMVHPSEYEGLSLALIEARSLGVPVIATEVGGIPEALRGYGRRLFLDERSARGIASKILEIDRDLGPFLSEVGGRPEPSDTWSIEMSTIAFYKSLGLDTRAWDI